MPTIPQQTGWDPGVTPPRVQTAGPNADGVTPVRVTGSGEIRVETPELLTRMVELLEEIRDYLYS